MLLEALIALGLTSFLVLGIANITRDVTESITNINTISQHQHKIIAVTNQLERDFSALAVIQVAKDAEDKTPDAKPEESKKKKISRALIGQADHNDTIKIEKKEFPSFKVLNGLTTSTLEAYGEQKPHLVRFSYKLIKQTSSAPYQKVRAFKLYRKETINLDDLNLKKDEALREDQFATSSEWVLICDNISDFSVQYSTYMHDTTTT